MCGRNDALQMSLPFTIVLNTTKFKQLATWIQIFFLPFFSNSQDSNCSYVTWQQETFFTAIENAKHLTRTHTVQALCMTDSREPGNWGVSKAPVSHPALVAEVAFLCPEGHAARGVVADRGAIREARYPHQGNVTSRLPRSLPCSLRSRPDRMALGLR